MALERTMPHPAIDRWLPDETLFSLASRHHLISGNARADMTCRQLFGHPRHGSAHDIPARVDEFVRRTDGALGDAERIIRERSILPFYFAYREPEDAANAIAAIRCGGIGGLKGRLGILASRFGAAHPLKLCRVCVVEDRVSQHVSYWHRDHQWPGSWVCLRHQIPLLRVREKVNLAGRFHWFLPSEIAAVEVVPERCWEEVKDVLTAVSVCSSGVSETGSPRHFQRDLLIGTYRRRLEELGAVSPSGRVDTAGLTELMEPVWRAWRVLGEMTAVESKHSLRADQFIGLLRPYRATGHPIRHFLLVTALFGNWQAFVAAYLFLSRRPSIAHGNVVVPRLAEICTDSAEHSSSKSKLVAAVRGGMSPTSAARASGVAVATAMAWIADFGLTASRRPKKLGPALRERAVHMLRSGSPKDAVASAIGLSVQSITTLLRTEAGLRAAWRQVRFTEAQRAARESWEATARGLTSATLTALRRLQPASYAWLYRNDRAWLVSFSATLEHLSRSNNTCIRWDRRDVDLSKAVTTSTLELLHSNPKRRLRLAHLCDSIPGLKARLSALDQLPLTRAALANAIRRKPHGTFSG
jgi:Tn7-like transposition protein D/TniQ